MAVFHAIFEDGVFRPTEPVDVPASSEVQLELVSVAPPDTDSRLDALYRLLLEGPWESGEPDVAARHDEHQP